MVEGGERLAAAIERQMAVVGSASGEELKRETLDAAFQNLVQGFDSVHGGWGAAPKFPQPMALEFLLRYHHATGDPQALHMVTHTLDAMARGGMYDQLGGGFHRYSVDDHWLVPHFEKMLYDNAQLARVYLHAWQVTGEPFYRLQGRAPAYVCLDSVCQSPVTEPSARTAPAPQPSARGRCSTPWRDRSTPGSSATRGALWPYRPSSQRRCASHLATSLRHISCLPGSKGRAPRRC